MIEIPLRLPTLRGTRVQLREWRSSDVAVIREASQDPFIPLITTVPSTSSESEALAFIERQSERLRTRAGYAFAIVDDGDVAVGHIGLFIVSGSEARASIGYWVVQSRRRRGYAVDALQAITSWARMYDGLDRLELYVEPWNEGSWRAAEQAGYQREGLLQAWERVAGEPRDMFMYSQLT